MVLPAGAHARRPAAGRRAGRGVRVAPPRRQLRRLHRGQVLRAHLQRVLSIPQAAKSGGGGRARGAVDRAARAGGGRAGRRHQRRQAAARRVARARAVLPQDLRLPLQEDPGAQQVTTPQCKHQS